MHQTAFEPLHPHWDACGPVHAGPLLCYVEKEGVLEGFGAWPFQGRDWKGRTEPDASVNIYVLTSFRSLDRGAVGLWPKVLTHVLPGPTEVSTEWDSP